jgi:TonB family protein
MLEERERDVAVEVLALDEAGVVRRARIRVVLPSGPLVLSALMRQADDGRWQVYGIDQPRDIPALAAELPPVEGALVALDTAMTPPKFVSGDPVRVPPGATDVRLPAVVLVEFIVTETGATSDVRVAQSAGPTLDEACLAAVRTWTYAPATKMGVKVKVQQSYQFNFKSS